LNCVVMTLKPASYFSRYGVPLKLKQKHLRQDS
jgi:hypothetical protein